MSSQSDIGLKEPLCRSLDWPHAVLTAAAAKVLPVARNINTKADLMNWAIVRASEVLLEDSYAYCAQTSPPVHKAVVAAWHFC